MDNFEQNIGEAGEVVKSNERNYPLAMNNFLAKRGFAEIEAVGDGLQGVSAYKIYGARRGDGAVEQESGKNETALEFLQTPDLLRDFFEKRGFSCVPPKSVVNIKGGSTLFISAGVQILDSVIHGEEKISAEKFYVAQPVFRTQFIPKINEGVSTSFVNISTEMVDRSSEEHFEALNQWIELLEAIGLNKKNITLRFVEGQDRWGERSFVAKKIKIYYGGVEIGDAVRIDMPQNSRNDISLSDIGFGLERIRWLLSGGSYFGSMVPGIEAFSDLDRRTMDYVRTLVLLAGSGVRPSNKEHGYRFRQLSKLLTKINLGKKINLGALMSFYCDDWTKWTSFPVSKEDSIKIINIENERNFNRELLDILKERYPDVDIDINQPTDKVVKLLNGTSVDRKYLRELLDKIL